MIKIAILGYGTVGSGVASMLMNNKEQIEKVVEDEIELSAIVDIRPFPEDALKSIITPNFDEILNNKEINICVETIGGINIAYKFTKQLLLAGKSVVTSNKELVAVHGEELLEIAAENHVHYLFEASVGGGIPLLNILKKELASNRYSKIFGILNGTTNYILSKMKESGMSLKEALAEAQELGYAEKDPTADICGYDAQKKIAILSDIAFGVTVSPDKVYTKGIEDITPEMIRKADEMGYEIKLIGYTEKKEDAIYIFVSPSLIPKDNIISGTHGVFNSISVYCDYADVMTFTGRGAGSFPTASAVVGDIITAITEKPLSKPLWKCAPVTVKGLKDLGFRYLDNTDFPILV